ncbi:hypothetical protein KUTeg_018361 [Tegillarca granosa]|uniref:Uncharacterized protein n=1 Tax=Tegillarca granosa TaxID=220873 RepID=A0ABQ9EHN4_TEGGR|nr:hypothetical protein KUTeg_018361 [Tegillarca granosa]
MMVAQKPRRTNNKCNIFHLQQRLKLDALFPFFKREQQKWMFYFHSSAEKKDAYWVVQFSREMKNKFIFNLHNMHLCYFVLKTSLKEKLSCYNIYSVKNEEI